MELQCQLGLEGVGILDIEQKKMLLDRRKPERRCKERRI